LSAQDGDLHQAGKGAKERGRSRHPGHILVAATGSPNARRSHYGAENWANQRRAHAGQRLSLGRMRTMVPSGVSLVAFCRMRLGLNP
jgi:hypothetical protein